MSQTTRLERRTFIQWLATVPVAAFAGFRHREGVAATSPGDAASNRPDGPAWQSGGTELIRVDYPGDDIFASGSHCNVRLTPATTKGPCYFLDDTGEDISLGLSGLPMQLCLRLIDKDCRPLSEHTVEVWHCDRHGVYSGDTRESRNARRFRGRACTRGDRAAQQSSWYRGKLISDNNGRVNFKTCFPGWYPGRTIHVHFAVSDRSGSNRIISQLCFNDSLAKEICTTHEMYSDRGEQDTSLAGGWDPVFPSSNHEDFLFSTQKNADGTLLAFHTIQVA